MLSHGKYHYSISLADKNSKGQGKARKEEWKSLTVCFLLLNTRWSRTFKNIVSFCTTANHWSDDITSKAYVRDIAVPYFKKKVKEMHAAGKCKPFGEQVRMLHARASRCAPFYDFSIPSDDVR